MSLHQRLVVLVALAPASFSQSILHTFDGDSPGDQFGASVRGAGDVNGDGFADLIVGARFDDNIGNSSGIARVFSGLDGTILYTFDGDSALDRFGVSVSGAGDVNGDGFADLIVGAYRDDNNGSASGSARVFSGSDGSSLHLFNGDNWGDNFGFAVGAAGDVDGDGFDDVIVGALHDDNNGFESGIARVFSGLNGVILYTFEGDSAGDWFGHSVSGAGDVNADGFDDLIVGSHRDDSNGTDSGSALVFSGLDGSTLYTFAGDSPDDRFGTSVSWAGDVNGDGFADVIVGAPRDDENGTDSGSASVFSGADGSVLHVFHGDAANDWFGFSASGAGDVNADGFDDLVVGAHLSDKGGTRSGSVRVFSGLDGSVLYTVGGDSPNDWFGFSVSGAGDVNGDGIADLIVGAFRDDNHGGESGSARVFSGLQPVGQSYCGPANLNSSGQSAVITATGSDDAAQNLLAVTASQLPTGKFGYFLNSDVQAFIPFPPGSQGNLCLGGSIGRHVKPIANSGNAGRIVIQVDLTALPRPGGSHSVVAGETWNFQCWFRDNVGGPTSNFTDGLSITFL